MRFQRFHVGPRLSETAVHNGTVYLAGQVPDDTTADMRGQTQLPPRLFEPPNERLRDSAGTADGHLKTTGGGQQCKHETEPRPGKIIGS